MLCADELNLGVKTTPTGQAVAADGAVAKDLFLVGALRKPDLWETTAVPELCQQAANTAAVIVSKFIKANQLAYAELRLNAS